MAVLFCCCSSSVWAAKQTAERLFYTTEFDSLFMEGLCYLHADSLPLAQNRFEACAKLQPKSAAIAFQLSSLYAMQQDTVRSIEQLKKATKLNPNNYFYYTSLAEIYTEQLNYKEAAKIYKKLTTLFPDKDYPFYMLSRCYYLMGDYKKSILSYKQLEKRIGINPEISLEKIYAIALSGDIEGVAEGFKALHQKFPINDDLYFKEGTLYYNLFDDLKRSIVCFEQALAINPEHPDALRYACDLYDRLGNRAKVDETMLSIFGCKSIPWAEKKELLKIAINYYKARPNYKDIMGTIFKKMVMADSGNEEVWAYYNDFLIKVNDQEGALEALNTCIEILPTCESCHLQRYILSEQIHTAKESELLLDETLKALPNHPFFLCHKAIFRFLKKDESWETYAQESVQNITDSTHITISTFVYGAIGSLYGDSNRLKESVLYSGKAYELTPDDPVAANNYAYYLALLEQDLEKAAEISYKVIQKEPLESSYLHTYGYILMKLGKLEFAKFYLHQAIEYDNKTHYEMYSDYAKLLEQLGEKEEAQRMFQLANEIKQENEKQHP